MEGADLGEVQSGRSGRGKLECHVCIRLSTKGIKSRQ